MLRRTLALLATAFATAAVAQLPAAPTASAADTCAVRSRPAGKAPGLPEIIRSAPAFRSGVKGISWLRRGLVPAEPDPAS
ncbi:hypothetical protein [Streptomyces sp. NPDC001604]|uniref:hypothetical protein n=1 Tax=Streptomyces sp. NPDC001604 TaxID=3364593 RepID=UPI0036B8764B